MKTVARVLSGLTSALNIAQFVELNLRFAKKQPVIWRKLLERDANLNSSQTRTSPKPARVPGGGEGTFVLMPDFFEMPDDFMEFFGGNGSRADK